MYELRSLYEQYGYSRYKVSKFEEYDLYARNKSFLISENILTFTDTNGKLMALKPDVTLSIVKNVSEENADLCKLYYNENVYRTSQGSDGFREIMQTGLECIGSIDLYSMGEVLLLAKRSLALISSDHILDISHMGILQALFEDAGVSREDARTLLRAIGNKNIAELCAKAEELTIPSKTVDALCALTGLYAPLAQGLATIRPLICGGRMQESYDMLCEVYKFLKASGAEKGVYLDFSMVNDMRYYNGIIFRGFIKGVPDGILSGGRYDSLLQKMGKKGGAIGFAVYLDRLSRMAAPKKQYDVEAVLLYDDDIPAADVAIEAERLRKTGARVVTSRTKRPEIRALQVYRMTKGGACTLERND